MNRVGHLRRETEARPGYPGILLGKTSPGPWQPKWSGLRPKVDLLCLLSGRALGRSPEELGRVDLKNRSQLPDYLQSDVGDSPLNPAHVGTVIVLRRTRLQPYMICIRFEPT